MVSRPSQFGARLRGGSVGARGAILWVLWVLLCPSNPGRLRGVGTGPELLLAGMGILVPGTLILVPGTLIPAEGLLPPRQGGAVVTTTTPKR